MPTPRPPRTPRPAVVPPPVAAAEVPPKQEETPPPPPTPPVEVGEMTVGEMRLVEQLRQLADQVVMEIGHTEVRKNQLLGRLAQLEGQMHSVLNTTAKRLGLAEGETWHVTNDGKVRRGTASPS